MESVISDPSVVVATKDHFSCPLGDDTIILDVKAGLYFSLDNVGAFVWQLVQEPKSVRELRETILETFEVDPEVCERDLLALLRELIAKNLVELRDAAAA
jgi:coenzyme PQQ synthesis protein D (PqqD)